MKKADTLVKLAMSTLLALTTSSLVSPATAASPEMEKCYGIVKKGMNDCQTKTASCAGSATQDNQPDAFLFLPKGTCTKIVGGSLKIKSSNQPK